MRKHTTTTKACTQRGSSYIEFLLCAPIILVLAGATLDIARYMRYQQLVSFVSQETANLVYSRCSDITAMKRPPYGGPISTGVDTSKTIAMVQSCAKGIQASMQQLLDGSISGAAIVTSVFRANISNPSLDTTNCSSGITRIQAEGTNADYTLISGASSLEIGGGTATADMRISKISGYSQLLSADEMCRQGRVVAVEVSYAFSPVVRFLPNFIGVLNLSTNGEKREITVL